MIPGTEGTEAELSYRRKPSSNWSSALQIIVTLVALAGIVEGCFR